MKFTVFVITVLILLLAMMPPLAARLEIKTSSEAEPEDLQRISAPQVTEAANNVSITDSSEGNGDLITVFRHESGKMFEISMDEYLTGVVAAEMYSSYEPEALKAQAVAARSYCEYTRIKNGTSSHPGASVCDDSTHCEAYISFEEACTCWGSQYAEEAWAKISAAVNEVSGAMITYGGKPANALFHASSHITTEDGDALWQDSPPYLRSVSTPEEDSAEAVVFTPDRFSQILSSVGIITNGEPESWVTAIMRTKSGRVGSLFICDDELSGIEARAAFGLRSCDFELYYLDGVFNLITHGYGHGIGMSQAGAQAMALAGASWSDIIAHYYPGTEVMWD